MELVHTEYCLLRIADHTTDLLNPCITLISVSRPGRAGSSCAIDTWPIVLGSFILCPPSGDGRVFKPCHRPGGAEFFLI